MRKKVIKMQKNLCIYSHTRFMLVNEYLNIFMSTYILPIIQLNIEKQMEPPFWYYAITKFPNLPVSHTYSFSHLYDMLFWEVLPVSWRNKISFPIMIIFHC